MAPVAHFEVAQPRLLISAFGIHMGGGLVLLRALIQAAQTHTREVLLDARIDKDPHIAMAAGVHYVPKSMWSRVKAQSLLALRAKPDEVLLSFNSLPPLFRSRARVVNYVHAPHFVGAHDGIPYPPLIRLRHQIERLWFRYGVRNCDEVWVQTDSMRRAVQRKYPELPVRVVPLVDDLLFNGLPASELRRRAVDAQQLTFFYPADAVGHKNHPRLLVAWKLLADQGLCPRLLLTLRPEEMQRSMTLAGLTLEELPGVENIGRLSRDEVLRRMQGCTALLFPSLAETFGIPMLEARLLGKPILASERDFVRDVCVPEQAFDPESSQSIARAVARFITGESEPYIRLYSATQFVQELVACRF